MVKALVLYALAEAQSGHATTVRVEARGPSFRIEDDGRGHALDRTVDARPYLDFIYTHLDYPFDDRSAPVQLHGIGMSLVNLLCEDLVVTSRRREGGLKRVYRGGVLQREERMPAIADAPTGNVIEGTLDPSTSCDEDTLRQWLQRIRASDPSVHLTFNGIALDAER